MNERYLLALLCLSSCAIAPASFDSSMLQSVSSTQEMVNQLFLEVEENQGSDKAKYVSFQERYIQIDTQLSILLSKAKALPGSQVSVEQLEILRKSISRAKKLHQEGLDEVEIGVLLQTINDDFTEIYRLQNGLKPLK